MNSGPRLAVANRRAATVPIGTLSLVLEALGELGKDGTDLLASRGIDSALLHDALAPISVSVVGDIIEEAIQLSELPHFAIVVGTRARLDNAGLLPMLLTNATFVRNAVDDLVRFLRIWYRGLDFTFHSDNEKAELRLSVDHVFRGHTELCTSYVASMLRHLETCIGGGWGPGRIYLARERPSNVDAYRRILRAPVAFDQPVNAIEFPAAVLKNRRHVGDSRIEEYARTQLLNLEAEARSSVVDRVQILIKALLAKNICTVERTAEMMAMHRKTLHRLLSREGTTFESLLDRTRRQLAEQLLISGKAPIGEIAHSIGYTSVANFSRAFKRWNDLSPRQWRDAMSLAKAGPIGRIRQLAKDCR